MIPRNRGEYAAVHRVRGATDEGKCPHAPVLIEPDLEILVGVLSIGPLGALTRLIIYRAESNPPRPTRCLRLERRLRCNRGLARSTPSSVSACLLCSRVRQFHNRFANTGSTFYHCCNATFAQPPHRLCRFPKSAFGGKGGHRLTFRNVRFSPKADISGSNIPTLMVRTYNAFSRDELVGVV